MEIGKHNPDKIEQLLATEAESFKLYPSNRVWNNIRVELHGEPKWPALGIVFLFLVVSLSVATILNYPPKPLEAYKTVATSKEVTKEKTVHFTERINVEKNNKIVFAEIERRLLASKTTTTQPVEIIEDVAKTALISYPLETVIVNTTPKQSFSLNSLYSPQSFLDFEPKPISQNNKVEIVEQEQSVHNTAKKEITLNAVVDNGLETNEEYLNSFGNSVVTKYKKPSKWSLQVYATPSISYRKLTDDKERIFYAGGNTGGLETTKDVNQAVRHKPMIGLEAGVNFLFKLTNNFHFKTGLQFNSRQYAIDAFKEFGVANLTFVNNNQLDSVALVTLVANKGTGGRATEIDNKLYQFSIPIGFQWDVLNKGKLGLSLGASIQPTYTLNKSMYLISTDYKYYANGSSFIRKVNINSSFELNLTYKLKKGNLFFGPQIRTQHLPTFNNFYPIKEYRMDYGFRFGLTKPL